MFQLLIFYTVCLCTYVYEHPHWHPELDRDYFHADHEGGGEAEGEEAADDAEGEEGPGNACAKATISLKNGETITTSLQKG